MCLCACVCVCVHVCARSYMCRHMHEGLQLQNKFFQDLKKAHFLSPSLNSTRMGASASDAGKVHIPDWYGSGEEILKSKPLKKSEICRNLRYWFYLV